MRRVPVFPTLVVALAVVAMIALGLWQLLDRRPAKLAFLAQLQDNPVRPPVAFPRAPDERLLYRPSTVTCAAPVAIRRSGAGAAGYRLIATCAGGEAVQLGTTRDLKAMVAWDGGTVRGYLSHAPDGRSLIGSLVDRTPAPMMLVAEPPLAGLSANQRADPEKIPNNHLAYAGQWFFFAAVAAVIYVLALRRRGSN